MTRDGAQPPITEGDAAVEAAIAHHRAGRLAEAEALYVEILRVAPLRVAPQSIKASRNLALLLLSRSDIDSALPLLKAVTTADPESARDATTYVQALALAKRFEDAERALADRLPPSEARDTLEVGLRRTWARSLVEQTEFEAAEAQLRRVADLAPDDPDSSLDLGSVQLRLEHAEAAAASFARVLRLVPDHPVALTKRAVALQALRQYPDALACADQVLVPVRTVEALNVRSDALRNLGRFAEARSSLDEALALRPDDASTRFRRAILRLLVGDFEGGWGDYEGRWRDTRFIADAAGIVSPEVRAGLDLHIERADVVGRRILLVGEQGVGDQMMFASMIPDLVAGAAEVTCVCEERLVGLFSASFEGVRFLDPSTQDLRFSDFDKIVPMGSLGHLFRNRIGDFPGAPYLRPREEVREQWAARLGPRGSALRIGLSWRGGTAITNGTRRSIALTQLASVLQLEDCEFVSLQYGDAADEVRAASAASGREIRLFPKDEIDDFEALAGLIANLDVVVSVQTAVVHLAGALGQACLAMVPYNAEWRYTAHSPTMPWYGSVRIFRQSEPDAWAPVIDSVVQSLRGRAELAEGT
jgi:tetratricopeptide (TPR) repeat protein